VIIPSLVFIPPVATPLAPRASARLDVQLKATLQELKLVEKKNMFTFSEVSPEVRSTLIKKAAIFIDPHRHTGRSVLDQACAALHRVPIIACDSPLLRTQWGTTGEKIATIHADDPVRLAAELSGIMRAPAAIQHRLNEAHRLVTDLRKTVLSTTESRSQRPSRSLVNVPGTDVVPTRKAG
jgi:hypothetical protein